MHLVMPAELKAGEGGERYEVRTLFVAPARQWVND